MESPGCSCAWLCGCMSMKTCVPASRVQAPLGALCRAGRKGWSERLESGSSRASQGDWAVAAALILPHPAPTGANPRAPGLSGGTWVTVTKRWHYQEPSWSCVTETGKKSRAPTLSVPGLPSNPSLLVGSWEPSWKTTGSVPGDGSTWYPEGW